MADDQQQAQQERTFTEAPASWNIRYRVNGFDEQLTLRGDSFAAIKAQVDAAREYVKAHFAPPSKAAADAINTEPLKPAGPLPVAAKPTGPLSFAAETLGATITDGKPYWKVKGGQFKKFGVTIWGEVLEASGLTGLDPMQQYSLSGWTAHYSVKDGKPEKVVELEKAV